MMSSLASRFTVCRRGGAENGYVLITLILFVALLAIAMGALAPLLSQQVKRDRELELIHRGVQYSRAIKYYVKKFGRYPTRIEELENTNNIRFLRKRYKDPVTGKDFKILHMGEVQISFGPGLGGAITAANLAAGTPGTGPNDGSTGNAFGSTSFGNGLGRLGGSIQASAGIAAASATNPAQIPSVGVTQPGSQPNSAENQEPGTPAPLQPTAGVAAQPGAASENQNPETKVFGGGPMVGVASISKDKSIRVFNKKDHYYQWQFIYDPSTDRGGLLTTPNQPSAAPQMAAPGGLQVAPGSQGGTQNSSFGGQGTVGFQGMPTQPQQPQQPQFPPDQGPQQP